MTAADPIKAKVVRELKHDKPLVSCRFDPAGRYVVAGSEDTTVRRWDLQSGAQVALVGHESWVHALAATPDGRTLLTGGCDGRLIWWPLADDRPTPSRTVEAHAGWVRDLVISRDGATAVTCGNDRMIRLWSVATGDLIQELPGHAKHVYRVAFDPTGRYLASADLQGLVVQWEIATRKEARRLDAGKLYAYNGGQGVDYGGIRDITFSKDGKYLACSGLIDASNPLGAVSTPAVVMLDWATGEPKPPQRPKADVKGVAWGIRFHPDGFLVTVSGGTGGGHLWFFRPGEPNEFATLNLGNTGRDLDLHPDGLRLATAHHDGRLRITSLARE